MGQQASAPALQEVEPDFFDGRRTEVVAQRPGGARPLWPWEQSQPCYGPGAGETSFTAYPRIEARPMLPVDATPNTAAPERSDREGRGGLDDDALWARRASKETLPPGPPAAASPWSPTGFRHHEVDSTRAASPPHVGSPQVSGGSGLWAGSSPQSAGDPLPPAQSYGPVGPAVFDAQSGALRGGDAEVQPGVGFHGLQQGLQQGVAAAARMAEHVLGKVPRPPRRRAVVIGVTYGATPCALSGPGNDALLWAQALERLGFTRDEMRVLRDDRPDGLGATRDEIWSAMKWLLTCAIPGDTLVLVYSGHVTEVPASGGGTVSCFLPADFATLEGEDARGVAPRWIPEPWLTQEVARLPAGADAVMLFDTSISPLPLDGPAPQGAPRSRVAADLAATLPPTTRVKFVRLEPEPSRGLPRSPPGPVQANVVCIATKPGAVAVDAEVEGRMRGVFTTSLCKVLRDELRTQDRISYSGFMAATARSLARLKQRGHALHQEFHLSASPSADLEAPFLNFTGSFHEGIFRPAPKSSVHTTGGSNASTQASSGGKSRTLESMW